MMPSSRNQSTQHGWKVASAAAVVCCAISALVASTQVAMNDAFGASDILPLLFWTLPLAAVIAFSKEKLINLLRQLSPMLRYVAAAALGVVGGVLWTYIVAFFLGAWFGAFSFSVLPCWVAGGAGGMIVGVGSYKSSYCK